MLEGPMQSVIYEDGVYGLPYACNTIALFYNVDMLEEAGVEVPTTWEELVDAAEKLTTEEHTGLLSAAPNRRGSVPGISLPEPGGARISTPLTRKAPSPLLKCWAAWWKPALPARK